MTTGAYGPFIEELQRANARLEGELTALRSQLASSVAGEEQLRIELGAANTERARLESTLTHEQRRLTALKERIADLERQLDESRRLRVQAEEERAAVIAALGRRARRAMESVATSEG